MGENHYKEHKKIAKTLLDWLAAVGGIMTIFLTGFSVLFGGMINFIWSVSYIQEIDDEKAGVPKEKRIKPTFCGSLRLYLIGNSLWSKLCFCFRCCLKGSQKKHKTLKKKLKSVEKHMKSIDDDFNLTKLMDKMKAFIKKHEA